MRTLDRLGNGQENPIVNTRFNLSANIRMRWSELSAKQRTVVEHIESNPGDVALQTASDLASTLGVSPATVVRTVQLLGYDGYIHFRRELANYVRAEIRPDARENAHALNVSDWASRYLTEIANAHETFSLAAFERAGEALVSNTGRVLVLGYRTTIHLARILAMRLDLVLRPTVALECGGTETLDWLVRSGPSDVVIALSHPRYDRVVARELKRLHEHVAEVVVLGSPVSSHWDAGIVVPVPTINAPPPSPFAVFSPLLMAIELLIATVVSADPADMSRHYERAEELWRQHGVFE